MRRNAEPRTLFFIAVASLGRCALGPPRFSFWCGRSAFFQNALSLFSVYHRPGGFSTTAPCFARSLFLEDQQLAEHIIQHHHNHVGKHLHANAPQPQIRRGHQGGAHQVAAHKHDRGVHHQRAQAAGHKAAELPQRGAAVGLAPEHPDAVGEIGEQNAEHIVRHVAPAVGRLVAEQSFKHYIQYNVQKSGQPSKKQVGNWLPILLHQFRQFVLHVCHSSRSHFCGPPRPLFWG